MDDQFGIRLNSTHELLPDDIDPTKEIDSLLSLGKKLWPLPVP